MVHHARGTQLPPLKMTLAHSPPRKLLKAEPPVATSVNKPPLIRKNSSVARVVSNMVNHVEMRYRSLREAFRAVDRDASGSLSKEELQSALFLWRVQAQGRHIDAIIDDFDRNGDGVISYAEFCDGLKPFTVRSQPVFGLADQHVTDRHRVLPGTARVLLNDNLKPREGPLAAGRADYELYRLPHGSAPASPIALKQYTEDLSSRIHTKFKKLKDAFRAFDEDKDGKLSKHELLTAVRCFNLPIPIEHVMQIVKQCDVNGDGLINYNEFALALKRKDAIGN